jgi:hypothetical protein
MTAYAYAFPFVVMIFAGAIAEFSFALSAVLKTPHVRGALRAWSAGARSGTASPRPSALAAE